MRHGVILAGGGGTRLWPASRRSRPKQFLPLGSRPDEPLIRGAARRLTAAAGPDRLLVVTAAEHAARVGEAVPEVPDERVLIEPVGRNTAAAIGLAAVHARWRDPEAVLAVVPADQDVADDAAFARVAERAFDIAERQDVIVTLGVVPTRAETGFGYLELGDDVGHGAFAVARFVEKPDEATARGYLDAGTYLWNAGMFFAGATRLLGEITHHMPQTGAALAAIDDALSASGPAVAERRTRELYPDLPPVSIDYGVMEKASGVITVPADVGWNDVGSWTALADLREPDGDGNVTGGTAILCDAQRNIVVGDGEHAVAVVGASDLVVVQSGNAILVVPRSRAQDVRAAVDELGTRGLDEYL